RETSDRPRLWRGRAPHEWRGLRRRRAAFRAQRALLLVPRSSFLVPRFWPSRLKALLQIRWARGSEGDRDTALGQQRPQRREFGLEAAPAADRAAVQRFAHLHGAGGGDRLRVAGEIQAGRIPVQAAELEQAAG